jgi:hypothetical protein
LVEDGLELLGAVPGLAGVLGIALDPLPVVLEDVPVPRAGAVDGAVPRLLLDAGARAGGLDEPVLGPWSQATSAKVASVVPTAMIVFFMFMIRLSIVMHRSASRGSWTAALACGEHDGRRNLSPLV